MEQPSQPRLYHELADLWPLVSPREEYAEEAATLRTLFQEKLAQVRQLRDDIGLGDTVRAVRRQKSSLHL